MAKDPSKTEQATPKRLSKQREEGNVAKSVEIAKTITIAAGTFALMVYLPVMFQHLQMLMLRFLATNNAFNPTPHAVYGLMTDIARELAVLLLPPLLIIAGAVYVALRWQVGSLWKKNLFKFSWSQFNIFKGLQNMMASPQALVRMGKSLIQALIVGYVPYRVLMGEFDKFPLLFHATVGGIAEYMLLISLKMVAWTLLPMGIMAAADLWYTKYQYNENIKMTKDEVKDEHKQSEGDPVVKAKQKQKMFAMMQRRMLQSVPKADVVITNPTHIAVALRYDTSEAPAPVIVAMGADHLAKKIKDIAREHGVPIRENVPLARALYATAEVGDMIPEDLYKGVASILADIWRIKGKMPRKN